jgi:hypothetical protein
VVVTGNSNALNAVTSVLAMAFGLAAARFFRWE